MGRKPPRGQGSESAAGPSKRPWRVRLCPGSVLEEAQGEERRGGEVLSEQKAPAVSFWGIQDQILPGFIAGRGEHPWLKLLLAREVAPSLPSSLSVQAGGANPNFSP